MDEYYFQNNLNHLNANDVVVFYLDKIKIIESTPITSRQKDVEIVSDFIFLGSKITVDGDCSHKIKTLAPWKKSYDKPRQ